MNKYLFLLAIVSLVYVSCSKEVRQLSEEEIDYRIDSISRERIKELNIRAQKALEHRIKIEVKIKADSIYNARMQQRATDTTQPANTPK
jgi:hypothetical protein